MASPPFAGGCLCGGVRFTIDEPLLVASYCHCMRCQRRTGTAASVQARVAPGSFRLVEGADLVGFYRPAVGFEKGFCTNCGAHLFSRKPDDHDFVSVRLGAFDDDPGIRPSYRQFVDYAAPWEPIPDDGLPRYGEARPA